jgi:DNA-binding MarR family transcriptional regulator
MSKREISFETTIHVRDNCLCLHVQRAARALARRFDEALKPIDLTNQQFSLLMALNRPSPPPMAPVANLLGMDRTSLTAALKPLERRGLVAIQAGEKDRRTKMLTLTPAGLRLLSLALPIWQQVHQGIEAGLSEAVPAILRENLDSISMGTVASAY